MTLNFEGEHRRLGEAFARVGAAVTRLAVFAFVPYVLEIFKEAYLCTFLSSICSTSVCLSRPRRIQLAWTYANVTFVTRAIDIEQGTLSTTSLLQSSTLERRSIQMEHHMLAKARLHVSVTEFL